MRLFTYLLGIVPLCSCTSQPITADAIEVEDSSAGSIHLRTTHPTGKQDGSHASKHVGVEIEFHSGEFDDRLTAGEHLRLDQNLISGPISLRGDFELSRSSIFVEWREAGPSRHRFTKYGGLSFTNLDMGITAGPTSDSLHDLVIGAMLGGRMNTPLAPDLEAYAKLEWHFGESKAGRIIQSILEIGAAWQFHGTVGIHLGWQLNDFQMERDSDELSDIDLSFGGPFVTLLFSR